MKRGFTLVELLGVIVILALLMALSLPGLINSVKKSSIEIDDMSKNLIYNGAKIYVEENPDSFKKISGNIYCLPITELVASKAIPSTLEILDNEDAINTLTVEISYNEDFSFEIKNIDECEQVLNEETNYE